VHASASPARSELPEQEVRLRSARGVSVAIGRLTQVEARRIDPRAAVHAMAGGAPAPGRHRFYERFLEGEGMSARRCNRVF